MVPENNADLIVRAFEKVMRTSRVLAIAGGANYRSEFVDRLEKDSRSPAGTFSWSRGKFQQHVKGSSTARTAYGYIHGPAQLGRDESLIVNGAWDSGTACLR